MFQSKNFSSNENQSKYGNKKPYNNIPPAANEELAPMLMTKDMFKDKSIREKLPNCGRSRQPVSYMMKKI